MDYNELLTPISDTRPSGEDLLFSTEYDTIKEARRADDPSLDQGDWVTDLKTADWAGVAKQCSVLLSKRSKDLQLAAWWTEAQTQLQGFAGLAQGYRLVAGLCDQYWDDLYPLAEDGDQEQRIGVLSWLLAHSLQWVRKLPVAQSAQGRYGLGDFEAARTRREGSSIPALDVLEAARKATPREFYMRLMEVVPDCREALATLERSVDARLGNEGPSFTALRDQLDYVGDVVRRFARDAGVLIDGTVAEEPASNDEFAPTTGESAASPSQSAPLPAGVIATRKDAIAQLRRVAEFFRRTEPHSPVAYLADKAARWGEMPLHVWLKKVIKDDATLASMVEMLDVEESSGDEQG